MMRYLLLSVLVVCVIGVMIPSAFAYHVPENAGVMHPPVLSGGSGGCIFDQFTTDIRTDKETYQSGETVNLTVEIFNSCVSKILAEGPSHEKYEMAGQHHDLKFMISEQGNQTVETVRIRVGEQKTFQFEPEIYTWTQEYQVNSAGQSGLGTGWNIKTLFNVLPAGGCGEGTVLVDGTCQLASTGSDMLAELTELNDFKKFIPDYYNYIPELSMENSALVTLVATIDKGDGIGGSVDFLRYIDHPEGWIWGMFNDQKDSNMIYGVRDHIPGLPSTCYEGLYAQELQMVRCIKDDVMITVMTNDGEHRSTMKQILNKMDGQLSLPGTGNSIDPLYIIIAVVGIGGVIGAIAVAKRGSKTPKPAAKPKPVKQKPKPAKQKPVEKKETSEFCENCGNTLNPKAKFCGGCGTKV